MIKGCAKRVVVVRDIESNYFEEAFFIVRPGKLTSRCSEAEYLDEAGSLVKNGLPSGSGGKQSDDVLYGKDLFTPYKHTPRRKKRLVGIRRDAIVFTIGFGLSAILCTILYYSGIPLI